MRIGELARALGTDPPTIRYYEDLGILPAPHRRENRYGDYRDEDVRRIELILALRRLDIPLDEIRSLTGACFDHRCATGTRQLVEVIDRRSAHVHRRIDALGNLADRFAQLRQRLTTEGDSTMAIDTSREQETHDHLATHADTCDCGCLGSGCTCGCACCGLAEHVDHRKAIEVLAQVPQTSCDCGCCA